MRQVTIRRCPVCNNIGSMTNSVVAELKSHPGVDVRVVDGAKGEFAVEVDGRKVAGMTGDVMPTADDIVSAVRGPLGASA